MKTKTQSPGSLPRLVMLDDDGNRVSAGDSVRFSYGIPPVCVLAKLVQRGKQLIALTPGHNPTECNLRRLRKHVGGWFKHNIVLSEPSSDNRS
jgi:hypothetical protein